MPCIDWFEWCEIIDEDGARAASTEVTWAVWGECTNATQGPYQYPDDLILNAGVRVSTDFHLLGMVWADAAVQVGVHDTGQVL